MNITSYAKKLLNYAQSDYMINWDRLGPPKLYVEDFSRWLNKIHQQLIPIFGPAADDVLRMRSIGTFTGRSFDDIIELIDEKDDDKATQLAFMYFDAIMGGDDPPSRLVKLAQQFVKEMEGTSKTILDMLTTDFLTVVEVLRRNGFVKFADFLMKRRKGPVTQIEKIEVERRPTPQDFLSLDLALMSRAAREKKPDISKIVNDLSESRSNLSINLALKTLVRVMNARGLGQVNARKLTRTHVGLFIECLKDMADVLHDLIMSQYVGTGHLPETDEDPPDIDPKVLVKEVKDLPSLKKFLEVLEVLKEG
jgi:hypothetical protein